MTKISRIKTYQEIADENGGMVYIDRRTEEIVDKVNEIIDVINTVNEFPNISDVDIKKLRQSGLIGVYKGIQIKKILTASEASDLLQERIFGTKDRKQIKEQEERELNEFLEEVDKRIREAIEKQKSGCYLDGLTINNTKVKVLKRLGYVVFRIPEGRMFVTFDLSKKEEWK